MNIIDLDNLELARYDIVTDDVDVSISVEDSGRRPDTTKNNGYLKVQFKNKASGVVIATAVMHYQELQTLVDTIAE